MASEGSSDLGDLGDFHTAIVEQVVEVDEDLMEQYLEAGEVAPDALSGAFARALREGHLIPVCFTSARTGVGVDELIDAIVKLCPSPADDAVAQYQSSGEAIEPDPDSDKPLLAHVFKVASDPFVGKLCFFKVHQGHVGSDVSPLVDDGKKGVRIGHVLSLIHI